MKLVILSDTHTYFGSVGLPDGDVLIHCGDFCSHGSMPELSRFSRELRDVKHRYKRILVTAGNHDLIVEENPALCKEIFKENRVELLLHEPYEYEGIKFFGSPYTPKFFNWAFMYSRGEQAKKLWSQIPDDTDVLFTHGMPYQSLDKVARLIREETDNNVGCKDLRNRIDEIKPKVFAGGHLHLEGGQQITQDNTIFVNAAICDDSYRPRRKPIVIEI